MTKKDKDAPLANVAGLMAERRQYEAWLAALEARRDTTPAHVFERVFADYAGRLERVLEQLTSHRAGLEERVATLLERQSALAHDEQVRRDERAELELRAHVGELTSEEFEKAAGECDREISDVVAQRAAVEEEVSRTRELLDAASRPPTPVSVTPPSGASTTTTAGAAAPAASRSTTASRAQTPVSGAPVIESAAAEADESPEAAPAAPASHRPSQPVNAPVAPAAPPTPARASGFDELAFLHAVVGAAEPAAPANPAAPPRQDQARATPDEPPPLISQRRRASKPEWISDEPLEPLMSTGDSEIIHEEPISPLSPLASNVTANNPIVLRPSGQMDQAKTLKCSECGAMNYPTEWYCERCGAELAAL